MKTRVLRYEHGSRVPGWDEAVDLTKPPATVPDPEPAGIGDQPQAVGPARLEPPESGRAEVVVDRDAHPGELSQIVYGPTGGGEVEVEQTHRHALAEHHVFEADVVVAHHRPPVRVGQLITP